MSQQNVELVLALTSDPEADLVHVLGNDDAWNDAAEALGPFLQPDFHCVGTVFGTEKTYVGLDGFRAFMLDWIAPWATYRAQAERAADIGDQVAVLYRIAGRYEGSTDDVEGTASWVWTLREGLIAQIKGYAGATEAFEAVGLAE